MHALIVLAHPELGSFNAHLATVAMTTLGEIGYSVETTDLYRLNFDPCEGPVHFSHRLDLGAFRVQAEQQHAVETDTVPMNIRTEIAKIERADLLIVQYPMWWFGMPAILKGWIDRTFLYGKMYSQCRRYDKGPCAGKRVLLSVTLGASKSTYAHDGRNADIDLLLWPALFTFYYVGFSPLPPFITYGVDVETPRELGVSIENFRGYLKSLDSIDAVPFNRIDEWDTDGRLRLGTPVFSPFVRRRRHLDLE